MNTQEYLSQVFYLDCRIKSKLEQIEQLRDMSAGTSVTVSDMPGSPNRNIRKLEDITVRLIAMENAAADAIDQLSKLKLEIMLAIDQVDKVKYRVLLEERYLCYKNWKDIAMVLDITPRYVHKLHKKALAAVEPFLKIN